MAFKVKYKGVEVSCENIAELDIIISVMQKAQDVATNANSTQDRVASMIFVEDNIEDHVEKTPTSTKKRNKPGRKPGRGRQGARVSAAKIVLDPSQPKEPQYLKLLGDKQKNLLKFLAKFPEGKTDAELRQEFKFGSNTVLAGIMSNIFKMANKIGMSGGKIISKVTLSNVPGNRAYRYELSDYGKEIVGLMEE